jgi:ABC-type uncharacterized transport system permease subunit
VFLLQTALKDIRRRLRDPMVFGLWLGLPIATAALVQLAFGGLDEGEAPRAQVWVVDQDETVLSTLLVNALAGGGGRLPLAGREVELDEGRALIENGEGSALLIIPAGFGDALVNADAVTLRLVTNPAQAILPDMVVESLELLVDAAFYVQQILGDPIERIGEAADETDGTVADAEVAEIAVLVNQTMTRIGTLIDPPIIDVEIVEPPAGDAAAEPGFADLFFPSLLFMSLFFMASGISEDYWVEKRQGTLRRALLTPHRVAAFLAGKVLAGALLMGVIVVLALVAARYGFGVDVRNFALAGLWGMLSGALLLLLLTPLQLYASSQRAGNLINGLLMMPLLILGGSFFPFRFMPEGMAAVGRLTPNGWALAQFQSIVAGDVDSAALGVRALGVVLVGAGLFVVASRALGGRFVRS